MIYYSRDDDLASIVEVLYLGEEFSDSVSDSDIFVNPENPTFIIGKIVIINSTSYPKEKIDILRGNRCKIIPRVSIEGKERRCPYILRVNGDVFWNGLELSSEEFQSCPTPWNLLLPEYRLMFPKISGELWTSTKDDLGNLTFLGWLLQQIGINIHENTIFKDLDLIKTKKIDFKRPLKSY